MKKITIVPQIKMEEMRQLLYEYLTELSEFDPDIKFDERGAPIYRWFDCYWVDKDRFPIYFMFEEKIAGFAMIREMGDMVYDFAEFYVKPEYRSGGNAIWFAREITNLFDGEFVFSTRFTNPRAIKFWGKFADSFGSHMVVDDEIWRNWTIRRIPKNHTLNLNPIYFDLISSGEKVLEGRLNDEKRRNFEIGDIITFYKEPEREETMKAVILDKYLFDNFDEMADSLDKAELGFEKSSKEDMVQVYRSIYDIEDEKRYGVAIFRIKLI